MEFEADVVPHLWLSYPAPHGTISHYLKVGADNGIT